MTKNTLELRLALTAIAATALLAVASLLWRFVYPGAYWTLPETPNYEPWRAFVILDWAWLTIRILIAFVLVASVIFALFRRWRWIASLSKIVVVIIVAGGTFAIYAPFYGVTEERTDRIRGIVREPVPAAQLLVVMLGITLLLSIASLAVSWLRHAPNQVPRVSRTTFIVLCGMILHLHILFILMPITNRWEPIDWQDRGWLLPFRPCRGALLWQVEPSQPTWTPRPLGRIDDLWLRFADPRSHEGPRRAVSLTLTFRRGYAWLSMPEANAYRVRRDDPAVIQCDARFRADAAAPAKWHELGAQP